MTGVSELNGVDTMPVIRLVLGVSRLGELDLRGWWKTHALDRTGSYVLSHAFPRTWRSAALELDVLAASRLHDDVIDRGRRNVVHMYSDDLPFRRWTLAWLSEQKTTEADPLLDQLARWDAATADFDLAAWAAGSNPPRGERLGTAIRLGSITPAELEDPSVLRELARSLAAAYAIQTGQLIPPYVEVVP